MMQEGRKATQDDLRRALEREAEKSPEFAEWLRNREPYQYGSEPDGEGGGHGA
jgi:hypothetical protein